MAYKTPFLMLLLVSSVMGHIEYPVSLSEHVFHNSYEPRANGHDSHVMEILGITGFHSHVAKSKKPVVVKFFSSRSINTQKTNYVFQDIADEFYKKIKFVSFDITSNQEVMKRLSGFFMGLAMQMQASGKKDPMLAKVVELIKRMVLLEQSQSSLPFTLFFKDGNLIFPYTFDYLNKPVFVATFQKQLLVDAPSKTNFTLFNEKSVNKKTLWKRIKTKVRNFWSSD